MKAASRALHFARISLCSASGKHEKAYTIFNKFVVVDGDHGATASEN
jgi:hypothetical protein